MKRKLLYNYIKALEIFLNICYMFILNKKKRNFFRKNNKIKIRALYLKKYVDLCKNFEYTKTDEKIVKKIWLFWMQGEEEAPNIVKKCIESVKNQYQNEYEITILTNKNVKDYIGEKSGGENNIPDYVFEKHEKKYITNTQFSDILRLCLLAKYGGIWIDATVLLTGKIPENILKSDFFCFHCQPFYTINNWLLVAKKNNYIINTMRKVMLEYWKYETIMIDYFMYHIFFDLLLKNNKNFQNDFSKVIKLMDCDYHYELGSHLLHKYDKNLFDNISNKTTIHKLSYRYMLAKNFNKEKSEKGTFLEKILELKL